MKQNHTPASTRSVTLTRGQAMTQALDEAIAAGRINKGLNRDEYKAAIRACTKRADELYDQANFLFLLLGEACKPSTHSETLTHGQAMTQALKEAIASGRLNKKQNREEYDAARRACTKRADEIYAQVNFLFLLGKACKPSMRPGL